MKTKISSNIKFILIFVSIMISSSNQEQQSGNKAETTPNSVISHGELANISRFTILPLRQKLVQKGCPGNCRQTQCPDGKCHDCNDRFYKDDGKCYPCSSTCNTCNDSPTECTSCNSGFYFNSKNCHQCSQGCSDCSSDFHCQKCTGGYFQSTLRVGYCDICSENCSTCSSFDVCTSCGLMWKLQGTRCIEKTFFEKLMTYLVIIMVICIFCICCVPLIICCAIKGTIEKSLRGPNLNLGNYSQSNDGQVF